MTYKSLWPLMAAQHPEQGAETSGFIKFEHQVPSRRGQSLYLQFTSAHCSWFCHWRWSNGVGQEGYRMGHGSRPGLCLLWEREVSEAKLTSLEFPYPHPPQLLPVSQPTRGSSGLLWYIQFRWQKHVEKERSVVKRPDHGVLDFPGQALGRTATISLPNGHSIKLTPNHFSLDPQISTSLRLIREAVEVRVRVRVEINTEDARLAKVQREWLQSAESYMGHICLTLPLPKGNHHWRRECGKTVRVRGGGWICGNSVQKNTETEISPQLWPHFQGLCKKIEPEHGDGRQTQSPTPSQEAIGNW